MFTFEYEFVVRLMQNAPDLLPHTREMFRYVDDLGNFSDLDLRPFLTPLEREPQTWDWIYPMSPWGPLSITDQTSRLQESTSVIYLNTRFTLKDGYLSYCWYDKAETYEKFDFPLCFYTHWSSHLSYGCKVGIINSQVRAIMIASSTKESCLRGLIRFLTKLGRIGCPDELALNTVSSTYTKLLPLLPVPFSNSRSKLVTQTS